MYSISFKGGAMTVMLVIFFWPFDITMIQDVYTSNVESS